MADEVEPIEGPCPTCKKRYGDLLSHGRRHHPYELETDSRWIPILVPPGEDGLGLRRSLGRERKEQLWENPLPYKGDILIHVEARSFPQAEDKIKDAFDLMRKALPDGVKIDLAGTRENF